MGFDALLGNDTLKQRLSSAFANDKSSHCYMITGPSGSGKHTLAQLLIAAMQCTGQDKPCRKCPQCHKVFSQTHPDVITVDEPEKANVQVKYVRKTLEDLYIRPNEGKRKVYLIPRGQALRMDSQNTLLKCIEEPPPYGAFIFLCEHGEKLLPTIRSRCVELRLSPLSEDQLYRQLLQRFPDGTEKQRRAAMLRSGGYLGQAIALLSEDDALSPQSMEFVEAFCAKDTKKLLRVLVPMEKLKRDQIKPILAQWYELLTGALSAHSSMPAVREECQRIADCCTLSAMLKATQDLKKALTMLEANVSPAHICGMLAVLL
ncbi:MAG: DNA polymerase III subunit [Ruminococcaceae bacterium]|nr:DNA polymerase III subunit [Oscillospiraceae bacterium]